MKRFVPALVFVASLPWSSDVLAGAPPAPVEVRLVGRARIRVQVSDGKAMPCDSSSNRMLFDGWIDPGARLEAQVSSDCICLRHTSASFPRSGWSPSGLACRPRICTRRSCRPAPDPTIRVTLDAGS